jgi:hypothetical protein
MAFFLSHQLTRERAPTIASAPFARPMLPPVPVTIETLPANLPDIQ